MTGVSRFFPREEWFMRLALREAERALEHDDVPIGCVVVHDGEVIGAGRNERELCAMCAGAIVLARVPRVVYGTVDPKAGAAGSVLDVLAEPRLNHRPEVAGGLLAEESAELLRVFFQSRR